MKIGLILVSALVLVFFAETTESNDFFQVSNNPTLLELSRAYNRYRNIDDSKDHVRPNSESFSLEDIELQTKAPETTTERPRKRKHKSKKNRRKKGKKHRKRKTTTTSTTTSTSTTPAPAVVLNENALDEFDVKSEGGNNGMQFNVPVLSNPEIKSKIIQSPEPVPKDVQPAISLDSIPKNITRQDTSELDPQSLPQEKRSFSESNSNKNSLLTGPKRANSPVQGRGVDATNQTNTTGDVVPYFDFRGPPPAAGDDPGGSGDSAGGSGDSGVVVTAANYASVCQVGDNENRKRGCEVNEDLDSADETKKNQPAAMKDGIPVDDDTMSDADVTGALHTVAMQNRKLIIQTITEAIYPITTNETEPVNGFKLLNTTKAIFSKLCPPSVIRPQFLDMAIKNFKKLHDLTTPERAPFISNVEYGWIDEILQNCLNGARPAPYIQDECKEEILAVNKTTNPLCLGFIVNDGRNRSTACFQTNMIFDPVMDVVWLMFESVKANCFDSFQGNIRLFQRYGVAMLDLYSRPMKFRWPLQRESTAYWERLLGPGLDLALRNIDKCVHHIINLSPFDFRTPRFLNINSVRLSQTNIKYLQ